MFGIMLLWLIVAIFIYSKIPNKYHKIKKYFIVFSLIVCFLIPTYDIIITKTLGAYFHYTLPKPFLKDKFEKPISLYVEDNVLPFSPKERENVSKDYLFAHWIKSDINITKIALNGDDGFIYAYYINTNSDKFKKYLELKNELETLQKPLKDSFEIYEKTSNFNSLDRNNTAFNIWKELDNKSNVISEEISNLKKELIKTEKITKDEIARFDYTIKSENIKFNNFIDIYEIKLLNKTSNLIGYNQIIARYPYNIENFDSNSLIPLYENYWIFHEIFRINSFGDSLASKN